MILNEAKKIIMNLVEKNDLYLDFVDEEDYNEENMVVSNQDVDNLLRSLEKDEVISLNVIMDNLWILRPSGYSETLLDAFEVKFFKWIRDNIDDYSEPKGSYVHPPFEDYIDKRKKMFTYNEIRSKIKKKIKDCLDMKVLEVEIKEIKEKRIKEKSWELIDEFLFNESYAYFLQELLYKKYKTVKEIAENVKNRMPKSKHATSSSSDDAFEPGGIELVRSTDCSRESCIDVQVDEIEKKKKMAEIEKTKIEKAKEEDRLRDTIMDNKPKDNKKQRTLKKDKNKYDRGK